MPTIVGGRQTVVEFEGLKIDELAGNVATKNDTISIAHVKVANATAEPWLTLHYDEWMCVTKGRMVLLHDGGGETEVKEGQTVFIAKGERFRPTFPEAGCEYIPVCLPAFRPDRCIREEEGVSSVAQNLAKLHGGKRPLPKAEPIEFLYHMTEASRWEHCKRVGEAYFPPTFEADGNMTHATAVPPRLIETANHFYQDVPGDWVCLKFRRSLLRKCGIIVVDEEAKPVGDQDVGDSWGEWVCPHIYGGIPPSVVEKEFPMARDGKKFVGIIGVEGCEQNKVAKPA